MRVRQAVGAAPATSRARRYSCKAVVVCRVEEVMRSGLGRLGLARGERLGERAAGSRAMPQLRYTVPPQPS